MLRQILAVFLLLLPALTAQTNNNEYKADWLQVHGEFRMGGMFGPTQISQFSNIPAPYRTVPWYSGYGTNNSTTISDATLNPHNIGSFDIAAGGGVMIKERVTLRSTFIFSYLAEDNNLGPGNTGIIRSVDITSGIFERGTGKSLVYYAVKWQGWSMAKPLIAPEVEVRIRQMGVFAGGWQRTYGYIIERGYDRYNALEMYDRQPFATVRARHYYLGVRANVLDYDPNDEWRTASIAFMFTVGPILIHEQFAPMAAGTKMQKDPGIMFGAYMSFAGPLARIRAH